tara:strand:+ start:49 stop:360 length:312 start_codon:yes stop_codon:yes gene_type:complete
MRGSGLPDSDILTAADRIGIVIGSLITFTLPCFVIGWLIGLIFGNGIIFPLIVAITFTLFVLMGTLFVETRGQLRQNSFGAGAITPIFYGIQILLQIAIGLIF